MLQAASDENEGYKQVVYNNIDFHYGEIAAFLDESIF